MKDKINIKLYTGKLYWITPNIKTIPSGSKLENIEYADISRAIMNGNNFNIEWGSRDIKPGEMKIQTEDYINYKGSFCYTDEKNIGGTISCVIYENLNGAILIGKWLEGGYNLTLIVELSKVEKFEDDIFKRK